MVKDKHALVYGLIYSLDGNGKWKSVLPKVLLSFDNPVLISTVDMPMNAAKLIYETVGEDRLYLDSGGFTLYKKQCKLPEAEFFKECERMKSKFLKIAGITKCSVIFELDNEYFRHDEDLMSPKNYCRQEIKDITGKYPTPVFKLHQGFQYWKDLCDSDLFNVLSVGGLAQTRSWDTHRVELGKMMNYARSKKKEVHLLGCQNVETFKLVKPTTVDYSIFQYAINLEHAKKEHPEFSTYEDLKQHAALYAFARAKSRSFLYEALLTEGEDPIEN